MPIHFSQTCSSRPLLLPIYLRVHVFYCCLSTVQSRPYLSPAPLLPRSTFSPIPVTCSSSTAVYLQSYTCHLLLFYCWLFYILLSVYYLPPYSFAYPSSSAACLTFSLLISSPTPASCNSYLPVPFLVMPVYLTILPAPFLLLLSSLSHKPARSSSSAACLPHNSACFSSSAACLPHNP